MGCEELKACGVCLWDASVKATGDAAHQALDLACQWCPATNTCIQNSSLCSGELVTTTSSRSECSDLRCHLAPVSFNIYICEGIVIACLWMNVILLLVCGVYFLWVRVIGQKPWMAPGFINAARMKWLRIEADETVSMETSQRQRRGSSVPEECVLCTEQAECRWCFVSRVAFLPILVAATTNFTNIVTTLLFSLRTHFYVPYMFTTTAVSFSCLMAFSIYVAHRRTKGAPEWDPYYLRAALLLKGRSISSIYSVDPATVPVIENKRRTEERKGSIKRLPQLPSLRSPGTALAPSPTRPTTPMQLGCSDMEHEPEGSIWGQERDMIVAQGVKSMQQFSDPVPLLASGPDDRLIETLKGLEPKFREKLVSVLENGENAGEESVVWCHKPAMRHLILHDMMFLHGTATVMLFSMLFFLVAGDTDLPLRNIVGTANLTIMGCVLFVSSFSLGAMFLLSCSRVYVLTTHNALTLCNGILDVKVTSQPNIDITCGMVSTYREMGVEQVTFSWRKPHGKMASYSQFTCISKNVDPLIEQIKRFCPPLNGKVWDGAKAELLQEWRVYMALMYSLLLVSITTFHYKTVPENILVLGVLCCASLCVAVFFKGMRHHLMVVDAVDTTVETSMWHKPKWVTKEVNQYAGNRPRTEDVLDSLAAKRDGGNMGGMDVDFGFDSPIEMRELSA